MRTHDYLATAIFLTIIIIIPSFKTQDCDKLEDGLYDVVVTTKGYENFELILDGNQFKIIHKDGHLNSGTLDWINCDLILRKPKVNLDTLSEFDKKIYLLGDLVYEINRKNKNKIKFRLTQTGNPHITINEGRLIKKNPKK